MKNIVILTHGWTGSSVFAALLARGGAWLGEQTVVKPDYDTFENGQLVRMNEELLHRLAPGLDHEHAFDPAQVDAIAAAPVPDLQAQRDFVARCDANAPWIWKDPRLTWTIRVWAPLLDLQQVRFIVLTRETTQAWITANLRRHVQSVAFTRAYNDGITASNLRFLHQHGLPSLSLSFEDLLLKPEATLEQLNAFAEVQLTLADLQRVCRLPLRRRSRGLKDLLVASLIYAKNYGERDGRRRRAAALAPAR